MGETSNQLEKWGAGIAKLGFAGIPNALLDHQTALDMSSTELVVLLHVVRYWYRPEELPRPDIGRIAEAMDLGPASVERCLLALEKLGYVRPIDGGRYDLSGLMERLSKLTHLASD